MSQYTAFDYAILACIGVTLFVGGWSILWDVRPRNRRKTRTASKPWAGYTPPHLPPRFGSVITPPQSISGIIPVSRAEIEYEDIAEQSRMIVLLDGTESLPCYEENLLHTGYQVKE